MKIVLLQTGKTTDKNIAEVADLYLSRIKKYSSFEIVTLPDLKNSATLPVHDQKVKRGKDYYSRLVMMIILSFLMKEEKSSGHLNSQPGLKSIYGFREENSFCYRWSLGFL